MGEGATGSLPRLPHGAHSPGSRRSSVSDRMGRWKRVPDGRRRGRALGVAEPAGAHTVRDVVDDVVVLAAVRYAGRHVVELQIVAHLPGVYVVGAGSVATLVYAVDEVIC